jgi:hypothetical protein
MPAGLILLAWRDEYFGSSSRGHLPQAVPLDFHHINKPDNRCPLQAFGANFRSLDYWQKSEMHLQHMVYEPFPTTGHVSTSHLLISRKLTFLDERILGLHTV